MSGVLETISLVTVLIAMLKASWPITVALILLPIFILPAKWMGVACSPDREQCSESRHEHTNDERFNVSGALLVKLFGRPADEDASFSDKSGRVRDVGVRPRWPTGTSRSLWLPH
jgi:ATP-binding cassette subfamily B protein